MLTQAWLMLCMEDAIALRDTSLPAATARGAAAKHITAHLLDMVNRAGYWVHGLPSQFPEAAVGSDRLLA